MTTNPYISYLRASGSHETFFLHREMRRSEVAAKRFREAGLLAYADLYDGYAEQTRLEIEALDKVEQRMAELDATLAAKRDAATKLIAFAARTDEDAEATRAAIGVPVCSGGAA